MQPFAVFAFATILVALFATFLVIGGRIFLSRDESRNSPVDPAGKEPEQPIVMTVAAIVLIGLFVASLFVGTELILPKLAGAPPANQVTPGTEKTIPVKELDELADEVDRSADQVYGGLEKTKAIIGKTEARNEAIEQGRDQARSKMKSLADRLRTASDQDQPVDTIDLERAKHLTSGVD